MLSQGLRKHIISLGKMRVCMIFTNQLRFKMNSGLFEDPLSAMYGGKAIPYYSSIMMKLRKAGKIKKD
jgi:RecA/RadA recombinase